MGVTLRFIGNVGIGKTTAICNLLNLTKNGNPILDVGAGKTTICQVSIIKSQNQKTSIKAHTFSIREFRAMLEKYIYSSQDLTDEIKLAIRNMINIHSIDNQSIEEFKKTFKTEASFISYCRVKAKYSDRILNHIEYSSSTINVWDWLKENFNKINTGRYDGFGIPKYLKIVISESDIPDGLNWNYIERVVDTKGIDNLVEFMPYGKHGKEVYCSSFVNGPEKNLIDLIRKSKKNIKNIILLVIAKWEEPSHVNGADGNYDDGVELKLREFHQVTKQYVLRENIFCYNAKKNNQEFREFIKLQIAK